METTISEYESEIENDLDDILYSLGNGQRNKTVEIYKFHIDGYDVPFAKITKWPCLSEDDSTQVYEVMYSWSEEKEGDGAVSGGQELRWFKSDSLIPQPEDFKPFYMWTITLDNRLSYDFKSVEEVIKVGPLLANAMAIAVGFTCHGTTFRRNDYGASYSAGNIPQLNVSTI